MPASPELASTTPSCFLSYIDCVDTIYLNKRVNPRCIWADSCSSSSFETGGPADETFAKTDTDRTPQLIKLREHNGMQAVLNCGSQPPTAISARNYQLLGMSKMPRYFRHAVAAQDFLDAVGSAVEGARLPAAAVLVAEQLPDNDPPNKVDLAYRKKFEAPVHRPISTFGGHAYDAPCCSTWR
ncbi:MAG: hypothetical protein ABSD13_17155 [Candidatus Korobacteraceae bacterium]|jgi:hypothetical protein